MNEYDVVVVGAGPAGSATAIRLAEHGHAVLLLDRARFPRPKPCAEYLSPGAVQLLARLSVPMPGGRALRGMELHAPDGATCLLEYRTAATRWFGQAVSRTLLDATLLDAARARGATVREGIRAEAPLVENGRVRGVLARGVADTPSPIYARLVVIADGLRSALANALGLRQPVRWPRRLGLVTHLRGVRWPEDAGQMWVGPHGYVGVAPLDDDLLSVGLVTPLPRQHLGPPASALRRALADYPALQERLAGAEWPEPVRGVGPLASRVRAAAGPGYLLVGDAAGFCDPFTGEGVYRALQSAELAAVAAHTALTTGTEPGPAYCRARRQTFAARERLTLLIQLFVQAPRLLCYAVHRLRQRPTAALQLGRILGDLEPASRAIQPRFAWSLLHL